MNGTPFDELDFDNLVLLSEEDIARQEDEEARREMAEAEAEIEDQCARQRIAEMRRVGQQLPGWALECISFYGEV